MDQESWASLGLRIRWVDGVMMNDSRAWLECLLALHCEITMIFELQASCPAMGVVMALMISAVE